MRRVTWLTLLNVEGRHVWFKDMEMEIFEKPCMLFDSLHHEQHNISFRFRAKSWLYSVGCKKAKERYRVPLSEFRSDVL